MPYLVMNFPEIRSTARTALYLRENSESQTDTPAPGCVPLRVSSEPADTSVFRGLFFALLFDAILAGLGFGLWELLRHI